MIAWERQEEGWYTSDIGGIVNEGGRTWFFYPADDRERHGPYRSMKDTMRVAASLVIVPKT